MESSPLDVYVSSLLIVDQVNSWETLTRGDHKLVNFRVIRGLLLVEDKKVGRVPREQRFADTQYSRTGRRDHMGRFFCGWRRKLGDFWGGDEEKQHVVFTKIKT